MLEKARRDYLTGFFLRDSLNPFLDELVLDARLHKKNFSIVLIDLDRFKKFNDRFGHPFGDEILKYAASTLRLTFVVEQSYLFRYGGDEFVAVFPNKVPEETFRLVRQCNYNMGERPFLFKNRLFRITISCGIAGFPYDAETTDELIKKADKAMYFSKRHGYNLTTLAGKMMRYIRIRNILVLAVGISIIVWFLFIFYQLAFKESIFNTIGRIKKSRKVIIEPRDLDIITLKNGAVFKGRILKETEENVIFRLELEEGKGSMVFNRSEIANVEYGLRRLPQKD